MINSNIHYHDDEYIDIIGNFTYIFCNIDNLTNKTKKSTNKKSINLHSSTKLQNINIYG